MPYKDPEMAKKQSREYRERNRDAILYHKRNNRLRRFGLQPSDLDRMLQEQGHMCAICGIGPLAREGRVNLSAHIDHCHECGMVRNILCKRCNTLVGFIESNQVSLHRAIAYHLDHDLHEHHKMEALP